MRPPIELNLKNLSHPNELSKNFEGLAPLPWIRIVPRHTLMKSWVCGESGAPPTRISSTFPPRRALEEKQ